MADSRSIIIDTTTQNGIKKQKSFTDVDPEATAVEMLNFANAAVALTTDTFRAASYVDKEYLSGGSITKEQLVTGDGSYISNAFYPGSSGSTTNITIKHGDSTPLTTEELCALNITTKAYTTDVLAQFNISNGVIHIHLLPSDASQQTATYYGPNQETTPAKPQTETKGKGRVELTVHDGATYKGFTFTINVMARGA